MPALLDCLRPRQIPFKKIRLGPKHDGGYVICDQLIREPDLLISAGIGNDYGFEEDYVKHKDNDSVVVHMFDHTVDLDIPPPLMFSKTKFTSRLANSYADVILSLLKMDVEGDEWSILENMNLSWFAGMVIEFHDFHIPENRDLFVDLYMKGVLSHYYLYHIHGNNYRPTFNYRGYKIPQVLEMSFINSRYLPVQHYFDQAKYPIEGLDMPNDPSKEDYELKWLQK